MMDYFHYAVDWAKNERFRTANLDEYGLLHFRDAKPLAATWNPLRMTPDLGRRRKQPPPSDFPWVETFTPVFSERAWEILRPLIESDAEALPVFGGDRTYYAIHPLQVASGVLDLKRALYSKNSFTKTITWVRKYVLRAEAIPHASIFSLEEATQTSVFVSEEFCAVVKTAKLVGLKFGNPVETS
jgi:hypothetical protein